MFAISKKKIIENYENQLKRKDESIRSLINENKELKNNSEEVIKLLKVISDKNTKIEAENTDLRLSVIVLTKRCKSLTNAKIERIKQIKNRTPKEKVKNKCENRILEIERKAL